MDCESSVDGIVKWQSLSLFSNKSHRQILDHSSYSPTSIQLTKLRLYEDKFATHLTA